MKRPETMTSRQAAKFLGVSDQTFFNWRREGIGPKGDLRGTGYIYLKDDLIHWRDLNAPKLKILRDKKYGIAAKVRVDSFVPPYMYKELEQYRFVSHKSMSEIIREAIAFYFETTRFVIPPEKEK